MRSTTNWLSKHERGVIYEQALGVLETTGMRMAGSRLLEPLADAGCRVDTERGVVRIPPELVAQALSRSSRRVLMAGARPERDVVLDEGEPSRFCVSGCAATTLDHTTGQRRPSTLDDLRKGTILLDETPELDLVWTFVTASDVPREKRELFEYYTYLTQTAKPVVFVDCPTALEPVREIFEIIAGDLRRFRERPRVGVLCAVRAPLEVEANLLDLTCDLAALGAPVWIYSMPISGATGPVTFAGTMTLMWAEILGTLTALQIASPGATAMACCGPGLLDMRYTTFSLGCFESAVMGAACTEIAHDLGLAIHTPGLASDAKHAGVQAGYEKALKGFINAQAGADSVGGGFGFFDGSNTFYMPLIPIDAEIAATIRGALREVEVSERTAAREMIERVGIGGNFLKEKETRLRIRAGEHFMPVIGTRAGYDQWEEAGKTEIDAAIARIDEVLAARADGPRYLSDDQERELARVCRVEAAGDARA
jgi:trimethylamine--corrinoid protein Co-methyltransferase